MKIENALNKEVFNYEQRSIANNCSLNQLIYQLSFVNYQCIIQSVTVNIMKFIHPEGHG
jgi:hypothetical protein